MSEASFSAETCREGCGNEIHCVDCRLCGDCHATGSMCKDCREDICPKDVNAWQLNDKSWLCYDCQHNYPESHEFFEADFVPLNQEDFNQASLNYSGHQNLEVRGAETDEEKCSKCENVFDEIEYFPIECVVCKEEVCKECSAYQRDENNEWDWDKPTCFDCLYPDQKAESFGADWEVSVDKLTHQKQDFKVKGKDYPSQAERKALSLAKKKKSGWKDYPEGAGFAEAKYDARHARRTGWGAESFSADTESLFYYTGNQRKDFDIVQRFKKHDKIMANITLGNALQAHYWRGQDADYRRDSRTRVWNATIYPHGRRKVKKLGFSTQKEAVKWVLWVLKLNEGQEIIGVPNSDHIPNPHKYLKRGPSTNESDSEYFAGESFGAEYVPKQTNIFVCGECDEPMHRQRNYKWNEQDYVCLNCNHGYRFVGIWDYDLEAESFGVEDEITVDEMNEWVKNLGTKAYFEFCYRFDIDPEDAQEMSWFIADHYDEPKVINWLEKNQDKYEAESFSAESDGVKRVCHRNITKWCKDYSLGWVVCPACNQPYTDEDVVTDEVNAESFVLKTDSGHEVEWDDGSFYMTFKEPIDGYGVVSGDWYGGEKESPDEISLEVEPAWDEENDDDYDVPSLYIQFDNVEYYGIRNHNMAISDDRVVSPELSGAIQEGVAKMVDDHADKTVVSREYKGESFGAEYGKRQRFGNRYVGRDTKGKFISNVSVGRSLKADRRNKSKTPARSGFGHRGDIQKGGATGFTLPSDTKRMIGMGAVLGGILAYWESKA